jgi:uncharacterized membrane protein
MPGTTQAKAHSSGKIKLLAFLLSVSLVLGLLGLNILYSAQTVALNLDFYEDGWVEFDVPYTTDMTLDELARAGKALTEYFHNRTDTPQLDVTIYESIGPLYNQRELDHLVDVRNLFAIGFAAQKVCWMLLMLPALYLLAEWVRSRRGSAQPRSSPDKEPSHLDNPLGALATAFVIAGSVGLGALVLLAVPAVTDFTDWWTKFHLLSFTNDLWLLDPRTDWLIKMFPEGFFFKAVTAIGLRSLTISVLVLVSGLLIRRVGPGCDRRAS